MSRRELDSPPGLLGLYARAVIGSLPGAGALPFVGGGGGEMPDLELELPSFEIDRDRLAAYARVCGFTLRDTLPPTYPHILAFPLQMALMTDGRFPFGAVGLIHIANAITQHRPIEAGERLSLRVRATELEPHAKGQSFWVVTEARSGDELVWEGRNEELHRGGGDSSTGRERSADPGRELGTAAEWRLPGDLGRRYAEVSGDRNPIHLYGLTAKAFGFERAIAHGMWTKARCLAALEPSLPDAFTVEARLRRPILLPATVAFAIAADGTETAFAVRDARDGTPHLDGSLIPA
jgi:acyl dehydratase